MKSIIGYNKSQCHIIIEHNDIKITDDEEIADKFNTYFVSIGDDLANFFYINIKKWKCRI